MDAETLAILRNVASCVASDRAHVEMLDHAAAAARDEGLRYWLGKASVALREATGHLLRAHALAVDAPQVTDEPEVRAAYAAPDPLAVPKTTPCEHVREGRDCLRPAPNREDLFCGSCGGPKCAECQDVDADCRAAPGDTPELDGEPTHDDDGRELRTLGTWRCRKCRGAVSAMLERCPADNWKRPAPRKARDRKDAEIAELAFGKGAGDGR